MYPKVCPLCQQEEERVGRGFEHVSMYLQGDNSVMYLRCKRCHKVFPWQYRKEGPPPAAKKPQKPSS